MRIIHLLVLLLLSISVSAHRLSGGDISLLPEYEGAGAVYKTTSGATISDLVTHSADKGMNVMRVRLFVDPSAYKGADADPNACQTLEYILPLCKRIKDAGLKLMLDFHYSDTWADPAKQYTPAAWASLDDDALCREVYNYTADVLRTLCDNGARPDFIQTGNEISYGMLWGAVGTPSGQLKKCLMGNSANWERLGRLLSSAARACREVTPEAGIVIHTERVAAPAVLRNFYEQLDRMQVDYDIIGLSYYPYFHGELQVLDGALSMLETTFPSRPVMIVETGYSYKWEVPGSIYDFSSRWTLSGAGQNHYLVDLQALLDTHSSVQALIWWWMEYNAFSTRLEGWYNAPLFDSTTGRATPAFDTLAAYATSGVEAVEDAVGGSDEWYDLAGRKVSQPTAPGIYVRRGQKIIIR